MCRSAARWSSTPSASSSGSVPPLGDVDISPRAAVESHYSEWAKTHSCCPVDDLLSGARQAYLSLAAVIDASISLPKTQLEERLDVVLKQQRSLEGSTVTSGANDTAAPENAPTSEFSTTASSPEGTSLPLDRLPIGDVLKRHIAVAIRAGSVGKFNPYLFAHPHDYIVSAKLQSFQAFEGNTVQTIMEVESDTSEPKPDGTFEMHKESVVINRLDVSEAPYADSSNSSSAAASSASTVDRVVHGPAAPDVGTKLDAVDKDDEDICDRRVSISATVPATTIPRSARAYAVVSLYVVTPGRRYYAPFDWFYDRIEGHESDNERRALATIFSMSSAIGVLNIFDKIVRLATGSPAAFQVSRTLHSLLRLPANIGQCPPCKRKYLGLYLSKGGEWTVAELSNSLDIFDHKVPGSEGDSD